MCPQDEAWIHRKSSPLSMSSPSAAYFVPDSLWEHKPYKITVRRNQPVERSIYESQPLGTYSCDGHSAITAAQKTHSSNKMVFFSDTGQVYSRRAHHCNLIKKKKNEESFKRMLCNWLWCLRFCVFFLSLCNLAKNKKEKRIHKFKSVFEQKMKREGKKSRRHTAEKKKKKKKKLQTQSAPGLSSVRGVTLWENRWKQILYRELNHRPQIGF